jgi:hypothetical protein
MGVYRPEGEKITLLIIRYPDPRQAKEAYRQFGSIYLENEVPADWPLRIEAVEDGRHVGALVQGQFLALAFDARSRAACERLLAQAARHF